MIDILKPFEEWVTALKNNKFQFATLKLTFFYVLSTAVILFVSSVAILLIFTPPQTELSFDFDIEEVSVGVSDEEGVTDELREHLAGVILMVDVAILLVVSILSYYFARLTLMPIKNMHEQQSRFMSDVAHELRTPLSVMQIGAQTMLRRQRSALEYEDFITDVYEEAGRLTRLSNQLLQLLRTSEVKEPVFATLNVSEVAKEEIKRFTPYATKHGVEIVGQLTPNVIISTERDSLVEIIQNVLKNAIDYNQENDVVTVTVLNADATVLIEVKDTGVGISANQAAVAFDRFSKADAARTIRAGSGAGLGLSIVKALVIRLGGTVTLQSEVGIGTTVAIALPKSHS